ncbi:MAG: DUF4258 domain-containing protein [Candidatus Woesebacteria bacterium]|jgi:hypothetical protein
MNRDYKNLVFTKHALDRLKSRSLTQEHIYQTINFPDLSKKSRQAGTKKFIKKIKGRKVHSIASFLDDQKKWLVISVWVRGEEDKLPFIWQFITLPFKLFIKILKLIIKQFLKNKK